MFKGKLIAFGFSPATFLNSKDDDNNLTRLRLFFSSEIRSIARHQQQERNTTRQIQSTPNPKTSNSHQSKQPKQIPSASMLNSNFPNYTSLEAAEIAWKKWDDVVKLTEESLLAAEKSREANAILLVRLVNFHLHRPGEGNSIQRRLVDHVKEVNNMLRKANGERENADKWIRTLQRRDGRKWWWIKG